MCGSPLLNDFWEAIRKRSLSLLPTHFWVSSPLINPMIPNKSISLIPVHSLILLLPVHWSSYCSTTSKGAEENTQYFPSLKYIHLPTATYIYCHKLLERRIAALSFFLQKQEWPGKKMEGVCKPFGEIKGRWKGEAWKRGNNLIIPNLDFSLQLRRKVGLRYSFFF